MSIMKTLKGLVALLTVPLLLAMTAATVQAAETVAGSDATAGVTAVMDGTPVTGFDPTGDGVWHVTDPERVRIGNIPDGWTLSAKNGACDQAHGCVNETVWTLRSIDGTRTRTWTFLETTAGTHTVRFDTMRPDLIIPVQTVRDGDTVAEPDVKDGPDANNLLYYQLGGWDLDGQPYDFTRPVTGDITLTARWAVMTTDAPKITFDPANGTPATMFGLAGTHVQRPADPTRDGYEFTGWYTDDGKPYDFSQPVKGRNLTLTARWRKTADTDTNQGSQTGQSNPGDKSADTGTTAFPSTKESGTGAPQQLASTGVDVLTMMGVGFLPLAVGSGLLVWRRIGRRD
ncbi:InlB B-repeat-containing protein [Bifidobacterium felsineum]|uniref:InlB B-repeat-containing protein n=1 Tax=Bifidobacterium felsineum TaxID=2045440 RepID=UPI001BDD04EC|nr:InlB B-repeat-containing protein [Bifidobacterium felsineum]MBT1164829.1 InlB B-repeat-containing protein [Bifidobacterium felsineum]